ncbi:carbamoyl phosphate synthase small subunit, partial [Nostoc sp. 3335mG]
TRLRKGFGEGVFSRASSHGKPSPDPSRKREGSTDAIDVHVKGN